MNGNIEFKLESKGIMVSLPVCVESFGIVRQILDVVEENNGFHDGGVSDVVVVPDDGLKDRVVGFILKRKNDTFTKIALMKFLVGVAESDIDHVLSVLISEDSLYQWYQDKYECFRMKKKFFELYGGGVR